MCFRASRLVSEEPDKCRFPAHEPRVKTNFYDQKRLKRALTFGCIVFLCFFNGVEKTCIYAMRSSAHTAKSFLLALQPTTAFPLQKQNLNS